MPEDPDNPTPSFSSARRFGTGFGVLVGVVAFVAIVLMVNFLGTRHFTRGTLSVDRVPPLATVTLQVLGVLTNDLQVTLFFDPDETLYSHILLTLRQYADASPRVKITTVNYLTEPAKAEQVKTAYKLPPGTKDVVIFSLNGRSRVVRQGELSEYDTSKLLSQESKTVKRKSFSGESFFTSAIYSLVETRRPTVYFMVGHDEHDPSVSATQTGYGKLTMLLQANNMDTMQLPLLGTNEVPSDCSLLIIGGPKTPFNGTQREKLNRYLNQGGRALLLLHAGSNHELEPLLEQWGVDLGDNVVTDAVGDRSESHLTLNNFGDHEIVKPFGATQNGLVVAPPRSVSSRAIGPGSDAPQVRPLVSTSPRGQAISDYRGSRQFDLKRDRQGEIPVAVAVERGGLRSVAGGSTRMVIVGDSYFLGNLMIDNSVNRDFAGNAINWLVDRPRLVGIAPRPAREYLFQMSDSQLQSVQWILLLGVPGGVLAVGLLVWFRRQM